MSPSSPPDKVGVRTNCPDPLSLIPLAPHGESGIALRLAMCYFITEPELLQHQSYLVGDMAIEREKTMVEIDDLLRGIFGSYVKRHHQSADLDMTLGQLECLRAINQLGAPSMSELSRQLHLQPSTLTGLVDGLVQRGRVVRREDPSDRRVVRVELTDHGRKEGQRSHEQVKKRLMELLGELGDGDLEALHRGLGLVYAAAQRRMQEQGGAGTSLSSGEHSA